MNILIERLKTEGVVDVFQTIRKLRMQRAGMVASVVGVLTTQHTPTHCELFLFLSPLGAIQVLLQDSAGIPGLL